MLSRSRASVKRITTDRLSQSVSMAIIKSEKEIRSKPATPLTSSQIHCISCHRLTDRVFTSTGKIYQGVTFIEKPRIDTELTYDDQGKLIDETLIITQLKRPIGKWLKGNICDSCVKSQGLKTITKYRKVWTMVKGKATEVLEEYFEPVVQLDTVKVWTENRQGKRVLKPSYSVSVNPGWSKADALNLDTEFNPNSELWTPPVKEDIDVACYRKFTRGR
jgi:YD repeat-containing protein